MDIRLTRHDDHVHAALAGPIDDRAKEPFRTHLHPVVADRGTRLVLDLKDCPQINSQGISNLVTLAADANTKGSRLILCNLSPYVARVLGVTKLNTFFEIAPDAASAVAEA